GFFREVFRKVKELDPDLPLAPEDGPMDERRVRRILEALSPRRLALFIDEFECISQSKAFPARFFVFLRGLSFHYHISFIVATRTRLFECCSHEVVTSPFPNIFRTVEIGPFSKEEFDHFIKRTSSTSGCPMWQVKPQVEQLAGTFPYLVQMACWHYFQAWEAKGSFDGSVHERVRLRYEDEAYAHFEAVWHRYLSDEERNVLLGALHEVPVARPNVIWRLEKKGYLANGRVVPSSFAEWIKREAAREPLKEAPRGTGEVGTPTPVSPIGIWVDAESGCVYMNGELLAPPLTDKQFRLLKLLFENRGRICTPYMIISAVYSEDYIDQVDDQRIHQLISRLRRRLEPEGKPWRYIITVHGRGFTLGDGTPQPDK
ncbi:MAG: winged helix-turn-helix domain-containing protein, partial [Chloroflexi bacterium]|nr:winged helix-turn-helix domain-containing protein [Chloroflexota bacterium]